MCIDAHVSGSPSQRLVLAIRNVALSVGVNVFLGQAEVDHMDAGVLLVGLPSNEKVLRLNVAVDQVLAVDVLHTRQQLHAQKQDSFQRELAVAQVKEILQTRSKELHHQGVVLPTGTKIINFRYPL